MSSNENAWTERLYLPKQSLGRAFSLSFSLGMLIFLGLRFTSATIPVMSNSLLVFLQYLYFVLPVVESHNVNRRLYKPSFIFLRQRYK